MGWARTCEAEYCALAEIEDIPLLTADDRLVRAARGRLPYVLRVADEARRVAQKAPLRGSSVRSDPRLELPQPGGGE